MIGVLASGSAFTASNTMPTDTNAGTGTVAVSGYTATSINYNLAADRSKISTVDIVIAGEVDSASNAHLQLSDAGTWYDCTVGTHDATDNETPLDCNTLDADVETANNLTLVITD